METGPGRKSMQLGFLVVGRRLRFDLRACFIDPRAHSSVEDRAESSCLSPKKKELGEMASSPACGTELRNRNSFMNAMEHLCKAELLSSKSFHIVISCSFEGLIHVYF